MLLSFIFLFLHLRSVAHCYLTTSFPHLVGDPCSRFTLTALYYHHHFFKILFDRSLSKSGLQCWGIKIELIYIFYIRNDRLVNSLSNLSE